MERKGTRKAIALATVAAMLLAWLAVEVATSGAGQAGAAGTSGIEFRRATRYYGVGPSAVYDFDSGSIGVVRPLRLSFASGTTFDVVITIATTAALRGFHRSDMPPAPDWAENLLGYIATESRHVVEAFGREGREPDPPEPPLAG